jgi:tripartite-type tricarboxylate transporter receptor subunit TctC
MRPEWQRTAAGHDLACHSEAEPFSMKTFAIFSRTMVATTLLACSTASFAQQDYPNKPVRLVSGYAPGGTTSLVGRMIGARLSESLGQQFILDNRPGGGTLIGGEIVAKAPPDGYTLMLVDSVHVLAPVLLKAPFDPIKDFTPIATVASTELVLMVHPSLPPNNLKELIAYAKARPDQINYATPALGGSQHLATEMFNIATGIQTQHVPYKGAGPALIALVSGEVKMYFATTSTGAPHVKAGKVKTIGITGKKRSALLPQTLTFEEQGLTEFYSHKRPPFGIIGPARMPKSVVDKLSNEVAKHLAHQETHDSFVNIGLDPIVSTPQEYGEMLKSGHAWNVNTVALLRKRGVKFDF